MVAAVGPLTRPQAVEQIRRLREASGDTRSASRSEIDEFLADQAFQAEACESLTNRQKTTIVARFREAIGRLTVDRATLTAWRVTAQQAWTAVGRRVGTLMLVAAVAAGAGGCGTTRSHTPEPATSSSSATVLEPAEYAENSIPAVDVPDDVTKFFGSQDKAQAAYEKATKAFIAQQMNPTILRLKRSKVAPTDFPIRSALTPAMRAVFDANLVRGASDDQAFRDAIALSRYGAEAQLSGAKLTAGLKVGVVQKRLTKPRLGMQKDRRPAVTFESRGAVRLTKPDGQRVRSTYASLTTLVITRDGLIDGWTTDWTKIDPGPDSADKTATDGR